MMNTIKLSTRTIWVLIYTNWCGISQRITGILSDSKKKSTIDALDGVRAFACISVVFFHLNYAAREIHIWYPIHDLGSLVGAVALAGDSGVPLFFVLSGFLLFMPYAKAMLFEKTWPSTRLFYLRRAFRILPAYYVSLVILLLVSHPEFLQPDHWRDTWLFLVFFMDAPATFQKVNGPYWTLAVEAQFYMLLPWLALGIGWLVRKGPPQQRLWKITLCLLGVVAWGLLSHYWGGYFYSHLGDFSPVPQFILNIVLIFVYGSVGKYLEVFAVGMLVSACYIFLQNTDPASSWNVNARRFSLSLWIVGGAVLCFMALWHFYMWYYNYTLHFLDPYREFLVGYYNEWSQLGYAIGFALCVFAVLFGPVYIKRPFEWAPVRWIGLISYSLYIWHDPLLSFFQAHIIGTYTQGWHRIAAYGLFWVWTLLVIIPLTLLSYLLIEKSWIKVGEKLRQRIEVRKVAAGVQG